MTRERTESTLKQIYCRSFLMLVDIPLILVFVGAEALVGYIVRSSAIETIGALQENVATTIRGDAWSNSLQLPHFIMKTCPHQGAPKLPIEGEGLPRIRTTTE